MIILFTTNYRVIISIALTAAASAGEIVVVNKISPNKQVVK
jgi:hypothetical protein